MVVHHAEMSNIKRASGSRTRSNMVVLGWPDDEEGCHGQFLSESPGSEVHFTHEQAHIVQLMANAHTHLDGEGSEAGTSGFIYLLVTPPRRQAHTQQACLNGF